MLKGRGKDIWRAPSLFCNCINYVTWTRVRVSGVLCHYVRHTPIFSSMEEKVSSPAKNRYAVVTGANKGIGFEICRQLASNGITVVLTARDEKRGTEALEKLRGSGLSDLVVFHQLDVVDPSSIASLADFVKTQFGRLDILVLLKSQFSVFSSSFFVFPTPSLFHVQLQKSKRFRKFPPYWSLLSLK